MLKHISHDLMVDLDLALGRALSQLDDGCAHRAQVSLTLTVERNETGGLAVAFVRKHATTEKGSWTVSQQPRLALEE